MKKQAKKNGKFTVTEVGALIETMRRELRPILEDIPSIRAKLGSTFEQVGKNTETLTLVGMQIKSLREKVDTLTGMAAQENEKSSLSRLELMALKNTVTQINGKLARIEEEIRFIKDNLISKADRKDFELLEKKVASLSE